MGRCQHCLSDKLRSIHFRPADFALILLGVRRYRCTYCNEVQSRWLLPWPLRWAIGLVLLVVLYFASAGPIDMLQDRGVLSDASDESLFKRIYAPIDAILNREGTNRGPVERWYVSYRRWWRADESEAGSGEQRTVARPVWSPDEAIEPNPSQSGDP